MNSEEATEQGSFPRPGTMAVLGCLALAASAVTSWMGFPDHKVTAFGVAGMGLITLAIVDYVAWKYWIGGRP